MEAPRAQAAKFMADEKIVPVFRGAEAGSDSPAHVTWVESLSEMSNGASASPVGRAGIDMVVEVGGCGPGGEGRTGRTAPCRFVIVGSAEMVRDRDS